MQIVATHKNTDFDALASLVAATLLYPGAVAVCPRTLNPNVKRFVAIHKNSFSMIMADELDPEKVEQLIVVDTNRWDRLDGMELVQEKHDLEIVLWDHHMNEGNIDAVQAVVEETGANISLMVREMRKQNMSLTPIQSTLFLIGLYEDTGHLTFPSTTATDAYAAAYLIENQADLNIAGIFLNPPYEREQKEILFEMMQQTEKIDISGSRVSVNIIRIEGHVQMLSMVVHMYRKIINADAVFVIFVRDNDNCMIIGRSDVSSINVGAIMRRLGGGGHPAAGSAMIRRKCNNPLAMRKRLLDLLMHEQQESAQISDIMSFPVKTISPEISMQDARNFMKEHHIKGIPVTEGENMVGILTTGDFKKVRKESQWENPVKAFMNREVRIIEPGASPAEAAKLMVAHNIGHLPVVENEKIIGIVTRSDTLMYFYDLLPE
ncbi:MAG: CBS domain-containing protein [Desulfococcaceae bacterium]